MQIRSIGIDLGQEDLPPGVARRARQGCPEEETTTEAAAGNDGEPRTSLIGLDACSGSHFLGRALAQQGHEVRLIPPQFVKPFVKSNKKDYLDAEAIAEAVGKENMRFVPIKTQGSTSTPMHRGWMPREHPLSSRGKNVS